MNEEQRAKQGRRAIESGFAHIANALAEARQLEVPQYDVLADIYLRRGIPLLTPRLDSPEALTTKSPLHQLCEQLTDVDGVAITEDAYGTYWVEVTCVERHRFASYCTERTPVPVELGYFEGRWENDCLDRLLSEDMATKAGLMELTTDRLGDGRGLN